MKRKCLLPWVKLVSLGLKELSTTTTEITKTKGKNLQDSQESNSLIDIKDKSKDQQEQSNGVPQQEEEEEEEGFVPFDGSRMLAGAKEGQLEVIKDGVGTQSVCSFLYGTSH